jgi:uncharacterized protein
MMRIAVLSDTHMPANCNSLPEALVEALNGSDLIIHAGDFTESFVVDALKGIAPVECVAGNMDSNIIKKQFPEKKIIQLGKFKIGIIHGYGAPDNIVNYAREMFAGNTLDCVIYGHSHIPSIEYIDETIYFCPGSPTDKVFAPYNSFGVLEINDIITPKIIRL